jgi:hypothetical protein
MMTLRRRGAMVVPAWYLGFAYAAVSGLGIVLGIVLRRLVFARGHRPGC